LEERLIFQLKSDKSTFYNNKDVHKQLARKNRSGGWLVLAYLENPADFPLATTCLQLSVTNHASAHTRNVGKHIRNDEI